MTTVNPFVFQNLNVNLCSHLIIIQTKSLSTDTDMFQSALSSDTRIFWRRKKELILINILFSSSTITNNEKNKYKIKNLLFNTWSMET
jgi:hypothetical protein